MRYSTTALALAFALTFSAAAFAKDMKIGFIRSDIIFQQFKGTKDAQEKYDKEVAKWEKEASEKEKKIKELQDQLDKQGLLMSEEKKKNQNEQINQMKVEYQQFVYKVFGQGGDALKKNTEFTKPILKRINAILDEIGKNENYDFIFDATAGGVVFAKEANDLSDRIVKELNKGSE
ncbi:MAG: OmpH family outer membrane protein [Fibrobacterota bacterium]